MATAHDKPAHEIILVPEPGKPDVALRQQCYDVRIAVFVDEQRFSVDDEFDDIDDIAAHFLLRTVPDKKPIGTIRTHRTPGGYYKLQRLALLEPYRKYGFGRVLVSALHDWARADARAHGDANVLVVCHSQLYVKPFYAKFGYVEEGPEFDEDGAPHQRMVLRLPVDA